MDKPSDEEYKKCQNDTLYWYNTYFLKEGEPKLTQEEWDAKREEWQNMRELQDAKIYSQYKKYPLANGGTLFSVNKLDD